MTAADRLRPVRCVVCGGPLRGRRDATTCGPSCRRERSRLRAILDGRGAEPYPTIAAYVARRQRRAKGADATRRQVIGR
jgi:hypothetical protein